MFALHPLYLSLTALAPKDMPEELAQRISEARVELDQREVEYEQTLATKLAIARELFDRRGPAELQVSTLKGVLCPFACNQNLIAIEVVLTDGPSVMCAESRI